MNKYHVTDGDSIVFSSWSKTKALGALKTILLTDTARGQYDVPVGKCGFYVAQRNDDGDLVRVPARKPSVEPLTDLI